MKWLVVPVGTLSKVSADPHPFTTDAVVAVPPTMSALTRLDRGSNMRQIKREMRGDASCLFIYC
ncbi:MAG TPA: hypothetical protein VGK23_11955 [Methanomassiliicoccales archaeon]